MVDTCKMVRTQGRFQVEALRVPSVLRVLRVLRGKAINTLSTLSTLSTLCPFSPDPIRNPIPDFARAVVAAEVSRDQVFYDRGANRALHHQRRFR
jgi:hypothetical protein